MRLTRLERAVLRNLFWSRRPDDGRTEARNWTSSAAFLAVRRLRKKGLAVSFTLTPAGIAEVSL